MIKLNYTTALAAGLVSVLSIGAVLPSGAQHGPRDYQRTALTAIKEGKWQEALDAVDRCIRVYEPRIKKWKTLPRALRHATRAAALRMPLLPMASWRWWMPLLRPANAVRR